MPTTLAMTGRTIKQSFQEYHSRNPHIYDYYQRFALELLSRKNRISTNLIIARIRWECFTQTTDPEFKINDHYAPHYARMFIADHPKYRDAFELRGLRAVSEKQAS